MKKMKCRNKVLMFLIVASLSVFLLMGCQSSSTSATNNTKRGINSAQMKQKYEDKLKELVTKGTVTQAQSDKILTAVTAQRQGGYNRKQSSGQNNTSGSQGNNNTSENQQNRQSYNPLTKLVQDGTINQTQADTVWQDLRSGFSRKGTSNSSSSNSTSNQ